MFLASLPPYDQLNLQNLVMTQTERELVGNDLAKLEKDLESKKLLDMYADDLAQLEEELASLDVELDLNMEALNIYKSDGHKIGKNELK